MTQLSTSQSVRAGHRLDPSCQISGSVGAIPGTVPGMVSGGIPLSGSQLIPCNEDLVIIIHIMPVSTGDTPFLCVRFADSAAPSLSEWMCLVHCASVSSNGHFLECGMRDYFGSIISIGFEEATEGTKINMCFQTWKQCTRSLPNMTSQLHQSLTRGTVYHQAIYDSMAEF